jgi:hypothetical protein
MAQFMQLTHQYMGISTDLMKLLSRALGQAEERMVLSPFGSLWQRRYFSYRSHISRRQGRSSIK